MVKYVIKENGTIKVKEFKTIDGVTIGITPDMFLSKDEIIDDILSNRLSEEEKDFLKTCTKEDLAIEHLGFGMWIRNTYGLWESSPNNLVDDSPNSNNHPDEISFKIMEEVKEKLQSGYVNENRFEKAMKILGDIE